MIRKRFSRGFTLIEMLIAIAMMGIVLSAIYASYLAQQSTYVTQGQLAAAQQNLRAAASFMESDLWMVGCNPTANANAGFTAMGTNAVTFTMDITNAAGTGQFDGVINAANVPSASAPQETVTYNLAGGNLQRNGNTIAQYIDALNFVYLDATNAVTADPTMVRSVQVAIVARTRQIDPRYTDTQTYKNLQGTTIFGPAGDHFHRRLLTLDIYGRNLGL